MASSPHKLKLHGFNNLTKTLRFNIYDINYALTDRHQQEYIEYIDEACNAERLTQILTDVTNIINLDSYLFGTGVDELGAGEAERIGQRLEGEMLEIFYGRNIKKGSQSEIQ